MTTEYVPRREVLTEADYDKLKEFFEPKDNNHCDMHQINSAQLGDNAVKISSLSSSFMTLKWVVGLGLPVIILLMSFFWSAVQDNSKMSAGRSSEIALDVKEIKSLLQTSLINSAAFSSRLDAIEADVSELKGMPKHR